MATLIQNTKLLNLIAQRHKKAKIADSFVEVFCKQSKN